MRGSGVLGRPVPRVVLLGLTLSGMAAGTWVAVGPVVEAAYAGGLPGPIGELLSGLMERRAERSAADYLAQVRAMVDGPLLLVGGLGLLPLADLLDARTGRDGRAAGRLPFLTLAVGLAIVVALGVVEGPRFALHVAAGALLLLAALWTDGRNASDVERDQPLGRSGWVAVVAIVAVAAAVRVPGLGLLDPYTDEYYHLFAAHELLSTGTAEYTRGPIVTGLVALSIRLAGIITGMGGDGDLGRLVATARAPFAIAGALTVVPVVLLARRVDRTVALVAGALWALSPWAIGLSRTVREYALFPLLALMFALALLVLSDAERARWQRVAAATYSFLFVVLLLVDRESTLIMGAVPALLAAAVWTVYRRAELLTVRSWRAIGTAVAGVISVLVILVVGGHVGVTLRPQYLRAFLAGDGMPLHWWGPQTATPLFVSLLLVAGLIAASRRGLLGHLLAPLLAFGAPLLGLTLLLDRYYAARYASAVLPWFTVAVAGVVVALARTLRTREVGRLALPALVVLLVVSVRPYDVERIVTDHPGTLPATGEFHTPVRDLLTTRRTELAAASTVIAVPYLATAMELAGVGHRADTVPYRYLDPDRFDDVAATMRAAPDGLMLLESRRNGVWQPGFPREDFTLPAVENDASEDSAGTSVELVVDDGFLQLYRWRTPALEAER